MIRASLVCLLLILLCAAPCPAREIGILQMSESPWGQTKQETLHSLNLGRESDLGEVVVIGYCGVFDSSGVYLYLYDDNERLCSVMCQFSLDTDPALTPEALLTLRAWLWESYDKSFGQRLPSPVPAWKTADGYYIVVDRFGNDSLNLRVMTAANFERHFRNPEEDAPEFKDAPGADAP